jgi:hypothetical protein
MKFMGPFLTFWLGCAGKRITARLLVFFAWRELILWCKLQGGSEGCTDCGQLDLGGGECARRIQIYLRRPVRFGGEIPPPLCPLARAAACLPSPAADCCGQVRPLGSASAVNEWVLGATKGLIPAVLSADPPVREGRGWGRAVVVNGWWMGEVRRIGWWAQGSCGGRRGWGWFQWAG